MPSPKKGSKSAVKGATQSPENSVQQGPQKTQLSSPVRFLLSVLSSLALNAGLFSLTSPIHLDEIQRASKPLNSSYELGGLLAWRVFEIGLTWVFGYDARDVFSFMSLTHLPTYALLSSFYNVRPTAILTSYLITLFSTVVPFLFFRARASVPDLSRAAVSNRSIIQDNLIAIYTTLAATSVFTVVLYISSATWLPAHLVLHFDNIPDIGATHGGPAKLPSLFLKLIPAGWVAKEFLFVSSTGAVDNSSDDPEKQPSSGSRKGDHFACALYRKTWGALPVKARVLIQRTITLAVISVLNTIVQLVGTVPGASVQGASGWGSLWAVATSVVGVMFGWIEAVDGV